MRLASVVNAPCKCVSCVALLAMLMVLEHTIFTRWQCVFKVAHQPVASCKRVLGVVYVALQTSMLRWMLATRPKWQVILSPKNFIRMAPKRTVLETFEACFFPRSMNSRTPRDSSLSWVWVLLELSRVILVAPHQVWGTSRRHLGVVLRSSQVAAAAAAFFWVTIPLGGGLGMLDRVFRSVLETAWVVLALSSQRLKQFFCAILDY